MKDETIGNFRLVAKIGAGGMGEVWTAEQKEVGTTVAIKLLRTEISSDKEHIVRFFNEARAVSRIDHSGIVKISDAGFTASGRAYLVMELLRGQTLADVLEKQRKLSISQIAEIGSQIASILAATHDENIIHRDLKPDNIFLIEDADRASGVRAKILDFGIAKLSGTIAAHSPQTQGAMGTPPYMAPEQWGNAAEVDRRADFYSFGCVLFEMASGRTPFTGAHMADYCSKHLLHAPPKLGEMAPGMPPALDALVAKLLEKRPADRGDTLRTVQAQLASFAEGAVVLKALISGEMKAVTPTMPTVEPSKPPQRDVQTVPSKPLEPPEVDATIPPDQKTVWPDKPIVAGPDVLVADARPVSTDTPSVIVTPSLAHAKDPPPDDPEPQPPPTIGRVPTANRDTPTAKLTAPAPPEPTETPTIATPAPPADASTIAAPTPRADAQTLIAPAAVGGQHEPVTKTVAVKHEPVPKTVVVKHEPVPNTVAVKHPAVDKTVDIGRDESSPPDDTQLIPRAQSRGPVVALAVAAIIAAGIAVYFSVRRPAKPETPVAVASAEAPPTCATVGEHMAGFVRATPKLRDKAQLVVRTVFASRCTVDAWPQDVIACLARATPAQLHGCAEPLGEKARQIDADLEREAARVESDWVVIGANAITLIDEIQFDGTAVREESKLLVAALARSLTETPSLLVEIGAFSAQQADVERDTQRANAVRDLLVTIGVGGERLRAASRGVGTPAGLVFRIFKQLQITPPEKKLVDDVSHAMAADEAKQNVDAAVQDVIVKFGWNDAVIDPRAMVAINRIVATMTRDATLRAFIYGDQGPNESQGLRGTRAAAVAQAIGEHKGIGQERILTPHFSAPAPVAEHTLEVAHARVEVILVK